MSDPERPSPDPDERKRRDEPDERNGADTEGVVGDFGDGEQSDKGGDSDTA